MSLDATGAKNFYYYGKPANQIKETIFPSGKEIWTQFPTHAAKIRIGAILALTGYFFQAVIKTPIIRRWCWPVAILGITLAAYVAYKHLLIKDPLVEVFYKIAGGKENYEKLPEIPVEKNKKTYANFEMAWASLEHPTYRFTTSDGRKGMLIKGLSVSKELGIMEAFVKAGPIPTQTLMIFVEKLGPYDVPRTISNMAEWVFSALVALNYKAWNNPFSTLLSSSFVGSSDEGDRTTFSIYAGISTDMANEFIAQKDIVNQLAPRGPKVEEVKDEVPLIGQ